MKAPKLNKEQRREILERDNFLCVACGIGGRESDIILEVHHKIPRSCGGSNDPSNLETRCTVCHDIWHYGSWTGRPRTFTELKENQGKRW
jgi:5-methylcytosine-specific restriction endonuclease McrA